MTNYPHLKQKPLTNKCFNTNKIVAKRGGKIAGDAKRPSRPNRQDDHHHQAAAQLNHTVIQMIEASVEVAKDKE